MNSCADALYWALRLEGVKYYLILAAFLTAVATIAAYFTLLEEGSPRAGWTGVVGLGLAFLMGLTSSLLPYRAEALTTLLLSGAVRPGDTQNLSPELRRLIEQVLESAGALGTKGPP